MPMIETRDGTQHYVKDWAGTDAGDQAVVLIHGWPLNADSWEAQALALAEAGHRVIAYDRRGFGRSDQPWDGYDYDTLADDLADVMTAMDVSQVALVGFSMGGGEVARYMSRHGGKGVDRVALIGSVVPGLLKSADNPNGIEPKVIRQMQDGIRQDRPEFFKGFFKDFYGQGWFSGGVSDGVLDWSWGMAMQASPRATLACVDAFGATDFTADVAALDVPVLIVHGTGDKNVPIDPTARRLAAMLPDATLTEYSGGPHGLPATHADCLSADLLAFLA